MLNLCKLYPGSFSGWESSPNLSLSTNKSFYKFKIVNHDLMLYATNCTDSLGAEII